jgi:hypothetical protein
MSSGIVFPVVQRSKHADKSVAQQVIRHWTQFRVFFDRLHFYLQNSAMEQDYECFATLKNLRFRLESEMSGARSSSRLVSLYRGMMHVIMAHQATWMLLAVRIPAKQLDVEFRALEHVIINRHMKFLKSGNDAGYDWLAATYTQDFDTTFAQLSNAEAKRVQRVALEGTAARSRTQKKKASAAAAATTATATAIASQHQPHRLAATHAGNGGWRDDAAGNNNIINHSVSGSTMLSRTAM